MMSKKDLNNFAVVVDQAIETNAGLGLDRRRHCHNLIHGMNNLHVSSIGRKRASSFKKPKTQTLDSFGNNGEMRPRTCSMPTRNTFRKPNTLSHHALHLDVDSDFYTLRSFSTSKGIIVNRGDSVRSRSTNSVYSSGSEQLQLSPSSRTSSTYSRESFGVVSKIPFRVAVLGAPGVGKTAITQQFTTSEYLGGFDTSIGKSDLITKLKMLTHL